LRADILSGGFQPSVKGATESEEEPKGGGIKAVWSKVSTIWQGATAQPRDENVKL
jgi:hypothetical protein